MPLVEFDIEKSIHHIAINRSLIDKIVLIVSDNFDDELEIGRLTKLLLTEAEQ